MSAFLQKGAARQALFTGPVRSGLVIDSRALLARGYADYQAGFQAHIGIAQTGEWFTPAASLKTTGIIPAFFIARRLEGEELAALLGNHDLAAVVKPSENSLFRLRAIDIHIYDMGYGAVTFTGDVEALQNLTAEQFRMTAEKIAPELAAYRPLCIDTFEKVAASLKPDYIAANFHAGQKNEYWINSSLSQQVGDIHRLHRIFTVPCADMKECARLKDDARGLLTAPAEDVSLSPHLAIFPGNGNSLLLHTPQAKQEQLDALADMVRAQYVYYFAAEDTDRDLFHLGNDLDRQKHTEDVSLLERQSEIVVEYQSKVTLFRAVYDDADNSLDPQALRIWHALENAWHTRDRIQNMAAKLEQAEKIYKRIRDSLNHQQNKRTGALVLALTLISALSLVLDTVGFSQGRALQEPNMLRAGVVLAALLVAAGFAIRAFKKR